MNKSFWETLSEPWQAALEMAWEGYCAGTLPIGAAVADHEGKVLSRGRNRSMDQCAPNKQIFGDMLAHAELNALIELQLDQESRHSTALYTTMEPCPLCIGTFYMSSIRTLQYAGRDPLAGSTNLLGTTPYLKRKPIRVIPPFDRGLEIALTGMYAETEIHLRGEEEITDHFFDEWRAVLPEGVELGVALYWSGELRKRGAIHAPAGETINWLMNQVK